MECELRENLLNELSELEKKEIKLKDNLGKKELSLIELRKTEERLRKQRIELKEKEFKEVEEREVKIPQIEAEELEELEKRYNGLKERKDAIEKGISEMESKKSFNHKIKNNFLLKEKLQDYLYENDVLERYLRSESFRSLDEALIGYKHMIEELKNEKEKLNEVLKNFDKEEK